MCLGSQVLRYLHSLCIAAAFVAAAQFGFCLPVNCSRDEVARTAQQVQIERAQLLALPIGDGIQTEVSASAQKSIASMKADLDDFMVAYMHCAGANPQPNEIQKELSERAHAFALKKRSYAVGELPKDASNYGFQLQFDVRRATPDSPLIGIAATFQIECGSDAILAVFGQENGSWNEVLRCTSKPYKTVAGALWAFDYGISPPDESGHWFVVAKSIAPWCSSTWSTIRYSVLRPVPGDSNPKALLAGSDFMWWGSDDEGTLSVDAQKFDLRFQAASIDSGVHNRIWVRDFSVLGNAIQRIQPVAVSPRDFVDEWISSPWKEASKWSASSELEGLRKEHERARKTVGEYDSVRKCTDRPDRYQIALGNENNNRLMYFLVTGNEAQYTMDAVSDSSQAQCNGPDILDSMATR